MSVTVSYRYFNWFLPYKLKIVSFQFFVNFYRNESLNIIKMKILQLFLNIASISGHIFQTSVENVETFEKAYDVKWFNQTLDHFTFTTQQKFKQKYLVNDTFWNRWFSQIFENNRQNYCFLSHVSDGGPIFFYTGNEGKIESFAENTGFMWDIAQEFGAMLVFAEHRYYGESLPFGEDSKVSHFNIL